MKRRTAWILGLTALLVVGVLAAAGLWFVTPSNDCLVADRIEELSTHRHLGKTYSVKLVTSGFQEKSRAVYLYEEPVSFDACGRPSHTPLATAAVDQGDGYPTLEKVRVRSLKDVDVVVNQEPEAEPPRSVSVEWALEQ